MNYQNILTAEHGDGSLRIGVITLNRPKQLNALNDGFEGRTAGHVHVGQLRCVIDANGKVVVTDLKSTNTTQTRSITTGVVRRVDTPRIVSVDDEVIAGDFVITIKPAPKP